MIVSGAGSGAAIENIAPVMSMRVDGPGAWRISKFSTNSADTICMAAEGTTRTLRCVTSEDINRALWDERAPAHAASPDYHVARFAEDPAFISEVDHLRPAAARLGRGAARRARAVPHRHRHGVAGPPRGADDRPRLLARVARRGPSPRRRRPASTSSSSKAAWHDAPDVLGRGAFDLVYTGIGALNWLPRHRPVGRRRRRVSCGPAGGCSCARDTLSCGRSTTPAPTSSSSSTPTSSGDEPSVWDEPGTYVATDHEFTNYAQPRVEPRARRDRHCPARPRHAADDVRRAHERAVAGDPRPDGAARRWRVPADRSPRAPAAHLHAGGHQAPDARGVGTDV